MPDAESPRLSLLNRMRDILVSFFVNVTSVIFFWLPGSDPAYSYILLAVQTMCYCLVLLLFFALPFIRLFFAACNLVVTLGQWVWNGCSLAFLRESLAKIGHSITSPFYRLLELLTGRADQFCVSGFGADGTDGVGSTEGTRVPITMEETLAQYGTWNIQSVKVRREPFSTFMNKGLDLITMGAWSAALAAGPVEKFYHMALILRLRSETGDENVIVLEKEALVKMSDYFTSNDRQEYHDIRHFPKITLNKFIQNAYTHMDKAFFPFDAFHNNCQNFILGVLTANVKLTKAARAFISQPIAEVYEKLPPHTSQLTSILTQFGAALDIAIHNNI